MDVFQKARTRTFSLRHFLFVKYTLPTTRWKQCFWSVRLNLVSRTESLASAYMNKSSFHVNEDKFKLLPLLFKYRCAHTGLAVKN